MRSLYFKTFLPIIIVLFGIPFFASADTLSVFPATGTYEQGKIFTVRVIVSSPDQAVNAASGVLSFPVDKLRVQSVSKADSVLSLWVQDPSFSNSDGTINFEGVVPNPGFTGYQGTIILITFKTISTGTAVLKFNSGTLLANDGAGTSIAKNLNGGSFTITPQAKAEQTPQVIKSPEPIPEATPVVVIESIKPPIFTQYPRKIEEGSLLKFGGTTYPNASVSISLKDALGHIFMETTQSDGSGEFSFIWPSAIERGEYELRGIVTYNSVKSLPSDAITFVITQTPITGLRFQIMDYTSLIVVIILCLALLIFLLLIIIKGLRQFKRKIWRDTAIAERVVHFEFNQLRDSVRKELSTLENVQTERELTLEEARILEKINKHIYRIEKNIDRRVREVKKDIK